MMDLSDVLLRFGLAFVGSLSYGLVRQRLGKPIGFGTFIFVTMGSCGLALTAVDRGGENPLPLLSAIVTGIGFLGAGALVRTADRIVGFTSAAAIWIFAVYGLTLGVGEYLVGGLVFGVVLAVTAIDAVLERRWIGAYQRKLTVELRRTGNEEELCRELGLPPTAAAQSVALDRVGNHLTLVYQVQRQGSRLEELGARLGASDAVASYRIE